MTEQAPTAWHAAALVLIGYASVAVLTGSALAFPAACLIAGVACLVIDTASKRKNRAEDTPAADA